MAKALRTGGEVDSWCTKCKLVLNHRIIAMVGTKPVRVECSTCGSHHNFRPAAPGAAASTGGKASGAAPREPGTRTSRSAVTRAEEARVARERSWEKAIAGHAVSDFKAYRVSLTFQEGDLVKHSKFGDGLVTRIIDGKKIEILFRDEPRTLAQNMTD